MLKNLIVFLNVISLLFFGRLVLRWERKKRGKNAPFIFLVYPGTREDVDRYFPRPLHPIFQKILPPVFPVGLLGRGLVMATFTFDLAFTTPRCQSIQDALKAWADDIGASTIALAGRMPGIFHGQGLKIEPPLVTGDMGTIHAVVSCLRSVRKRHGFHRKDCRVAVLGGGGFVGGSLCRTLMALGYSRVVALDIRYTETQEEDGILQTSDYRQLEEVDLVVVLTARGHEIKPAIPYMKNKLVVDDTHPQLPSWLVSQLRENECLTYKVVITLDDFKFRPAIPGYKRDWIPGCVWQAVVTAVALDMDLGNGFKTLHDFHQVARQLPYHAPLVEHYDNRRAV